MRHATHWRYSLLGLALLGAAVVRVPLLLGATGFERGDAVEYLNTAVQIDRGMIGAWWHIRPLLLPALLLPALWAGRWLGDTDGELTVQLARATVLACGLGTVAATYWLGWLVGGARVAFVGAALLAVHGQFAFQSVTPSSEVPAAFALAWAAIAAVRARRRAAWALAGICLGLAALVRYQSLIFVPPLARWALRQGGRGAGATVAGASLAPLAAQGLADWLVAGQPFVGLSTTLEWMVLTDRAVHDYGGAPAHWYLTQFPAWLSLAGAVALVVGLAAAVDWRGNGWPLIALLVVLPLAQLSVIGHKDLRFLHQVLPFAALLVARGAEVFANALVNRARLAPTRAWPAVTLLVVLTSLAATWQFQLVHNPGYVDGMKLARARASAAPEPTGARAIVATVIWDVCWVYAMDEIELVRGDPAIWSDSAVAATLVTRARFVLLREHEVTRNAALATALAAHYRAIARFDDGTVLYEWANSATPWPSI